MPQKTFLRYRYSSLFLVLATVFSSAETVCYARVIVSNGQTEETIQVDPLSGNVLKDTNGAAVNNAGTVGSIGTAGGTGVIQDNQITADWPVSSVLQGGAVANSGNIVAIYADFVGNTIDSGRRYEGSGGAIYNSGGIEQIGEANLFRQFGQNAVIGNKGEGGAISNASAGVITYIYADFGNNSSVGYGGAIYNEGTITQIGQADRHSIFSVNKTSGNANNNRGGAIANDNGGRITDIYADFQKNAAYHYGGAISNYGTSSNNSWIGSISGSFTDNTFTGRSGYGGAIANIRSTIESISGSRFIQNGAGSGADDGRGGAIFNGGGTINGISGSHFSENRLTGTNSDGGAIFNGDFSDSLIDSIQTVTFTDNEAGRSGGAVYNSYNGTINVLSDAIFSSNKAGQYGGAIHNEGKIGIISGTNFMGNSSYEGGAINNDGQIVQILNSTFEQNSSDWGGAISNYGSIGDISGGTFKGNIATGAKGGAIYNNGYGTITFTANNTFENNIAAGKPNDITNDGKLNFGTPQQEHEKTIIGSGIDGNGEMTLNSGELEIAGGRTVEQGQATFKDGTNVLVTVSDGNIVQDGYAANVSEVENLDTQKNKSIIRTTGGLTITDGASLTVAGANAGKTYLIAVDDGGSVQNAGSGWKGGNLVDSSNVLLDFRRVEGDTGQGTVMVTSSAKNAADALPCVDIPDNLNALSSGGKIDVDSAVTGIRFLSRATDRQYLSGGQAQMEDVINSAAQIGTAGAVKNIAYSGAGMFNRAVEKRLSRSGTWQEDQENGLWVDIIGMHQRNHGMPVCSGKECGDRTRFGHRIDMGGIVAGIDRHFGENHRAGMALMAGTGSASSKGDFNHTKNDTDFFGMSVYGGWDYGNWNIMGNVSYAHFDNDIDQSLPIALQMGNKLKADISSHQWSAGIRGEYRIRFENGIDLLPHAGIRYDRLVTSGFQTESDAGSVFSTEKDAMNIYSLPLGAGVYGTFRSRDGWTFRPQADLTAIFAAGDIRDKTEVSAVGLEATDSISTRIVDRTSVMAGIGFEMQKGNKSFGLHYDAMYSSRQMWQGVMAKMVCQFE